MNCLTCHEDVRGQFYQPFRHPVDDEIMRLLTAVGLSPEHRNRYPRELSGDSSSGLEFVRLLP